MKIVDRATFLALPENTLFAKYAPCYFEELCIKGETWPHDFLVQQIADAIESKGSEDFCKKLDLAQFEGASLPMDFNNMSRDGCFDADQLFAVYEDADVRALIARLTECLKRRA